MDVPGERYVVDTGHLVAWEGTTQYSLRKAASGFFRSLLSGEGIVAEFIGPGELLIQTRNLAALAGLLNPSSHHNRMKEADSILIWVADKPLKLGSK